MDFDTSRFLINIPNALIILTFFLNFLIVRSNIPCTVCLFKISHPYQLGNAKRGENTYFDSKILSDL